MPLGSTGNRGCKVCWDAESLINTGFIGRQTTKDTDGFNTLIVIITGALKRKICYDYYILFMEG